MLIHSLFESIEQQIKKRADFIIKSYGEKLKSNPDIDDLDSFIEKLSEIDPTPKGSLMPWIAKLVAKNPQLNKVEDLSRLGDDLEKFMEYRQKVENKDLNSYKSFQEVYDAIAPFINRPKTKEERQIERQEKALAKNKENIETVYTGSEGWIRIPKTKGAAQFIGQNTRWCTSSKKDNMFDSYNSRDTLFVIFDRSLRERFQLHIESGAYADSADDMKGLNALPMWARTHIINWYKENNTNLSLKQVINLKSIGADAKDVSASDERKELLDLMSKYGI